MTEVSTDIAEDVVEPTETSEETAAEAPVEAIEEEEEGPIDLDAPEPDAEPETVAEDGEDDEGQEEEAEEAVEMREFNFGGNKLEVAASDVPPEVADKIEEFSSGIWKDYTTKSQAIAEHARSLAAKEQAIETMTALNGEALQTYSHGLQLRREIEQLSQVDVNALWQSDPDQARRVSDAIASKQAELQQVVATVGQHENALSEAQQAELERRSEEGRAMLDKRISGFSTEKAPEVVKYAIENYGMDQGEADKWALNPTVTEMAYKAMMYDRMQAKASKPNSKPKPATPIKAIKSKGAESGRTHDLDKMSDAQFRKIARIG